jgi:hypothetical protein
LKQLFAGAGITMASTGGTLVTLEHFYGGWFVTMGIGLLVSAIACHAAEPKS